MRIFLAVAAILILVTLVWIRKRSAKKARLAVTGLAEQGKPLTVAPKPASKRLDTAPTQAKEFTANVAEKVSSPAQTEPQPEKAITPKTTSSFSKQQEQIPEDSTLRRNYLSARQAEKEAISHPYPTDSTLRRHHESMLAIVSRQATASVGTEDSFQPEPAAVEKLNMPEDSTLRRHFLTQLRAEIESQLFARPTDSTLKRHYERLVEAKMDEYLA